MNNKKLQKEIKRLNRLIEQQCTLIEEQNKTIASLTINGTFNIPFLQSDLCTDGKDHDYPMQWHGTSQPFCQKCGKHAPDHGITFTTSNSTGNVDTTQISKNPDDYDWTNLDSLT